MDELGSLLARAQRPTRDESFYSYGTVTVVSPLTVLLDSEATAVPTLCGSTYAPVASDRVVVLVQGADRIVMASALATSPKMRYSLGTPGGVGNKGDWNTDLTNNRVFRSDGTGWIIMGEPVINAGTPTVTSATGTITTLGARTQFYTRCNGYIDVFGSISITTNGTAAGGILVSIPVAANASALYLGSLRENAVAGFQGQISAFATSAILEAYNNTHPGSNGCVLLYAMRYPMTTLYS